MPKTIPRFNVGDKVRVCSGVSDPDYDDLTIGGRVVDAVRVGRLRSAILFQEDGRCERRVAGLRHLGDLSASR